ncbi:MAG: SpvB/TcaC N-terminal domain-containing protein, partial [Bacteroidota bacterium]|nr:SpvB/TcaC N-terminal domain-containing protein [Bacteroidota bacterium]
DKVWLTYHLTGVSDNCGVACSINDRLAFGGYLIKKDTSTTVQRIQLSAAWLQKGENRIQFGLPENADYGYRISDLALEVEKDANVEPLSVDASQNLYGGKVYVHGFLQKTNAISHISIDGQKIALHDGEFEALVTPNGQQTEVKADITGRIFTHILHFVNNINADKEYALRQNSVSTLRLFEKGKINELKTTDVLLKTDNKTQISTKQFSLTSLRSVDIPALDLGMTNVTADSHGFRFLPHGEHFSNKGATVALKYDRSKIPDGYTENDIRTFYFDQNTRHWVALERDTVDKSLCMVMSKTTHFTDMINGVIKTPESPQTEGFASTMMNDIKAADPTSKIELIAPPSANSQGSANLSYNLEMPPTRNGMAPQLTIAYNSDGGSGWLGEGWDLNIPSICVDTHWGVPKYDRYTESETYNLNGTMLATIIKDSNDTVSVSVAHRGKMFNRQYDSNIGGQSFFPRSESNFSRIIREKTSPDLYTWRVFDKSGTQYFYGYSGASLKGDVTSFKYTDNTFSQKVNKADSAIAEWKLTRIRDVYGTECKYYYSKNTSQLIASGNETAQSLYLDSISVGQENNILGNDTTYYKIVFYSNTLKRKQTFSARYGFFTSTNKLLDRIIIFHNNQKLRGYQFVYKDGPLGADLLDKVVQLDSSETEVGTHTFQYYNSVSGTGNPQLFCNKDTTVTVRQDNLYNLPALGGAQSKTSAYSIYAGGGFSFLGIINLEAGYNHGVSTSKSDKKVIMIDINGDGLPDKVYSSSNGIWFMPNLGNSIFGEAIQIASNLNQFAYTETKTTSNGWSGEAGIKLGKNGAGVNAGKDWSEVLTNTPIYFADVNNDGLVDIVFNGVVYFNRKDTS